MRKASEVLELLFKERFGQQFTEKARSTAGLFSAWADITTEAWHFRGEDADIPPVASHSRIREFEKGALLAEADHPGWVQLLQTKQQELLSVVRGHFPELDIRSISFCLSREPFSLANKEPETARFDAQVFSTVFPSLKLDPHKKNSQKKTESGNEYYYKALKRFELSVKERNDRL